MNNVDTPSGSEPKCAPLQVVGGPTSSKVPAPPRQPNTEQTSAPSRGCDAATANREQTIYCCGAMSVFASERVSVEIADHVATVTLTRPEKHNALDLPMFEAIIAAAERVAVEPGVRAVVLCGDGQSFCSGLDVMSVMAAGGGIEGLTDPLRADVPNWFQRAAYDWLRLPMPVIAAVHGNCLGGGLQIALAADARIARPDARLSVMEVKWGLIPDMSITRTLPRLVGIDVAKELTYTARVFDGSEALRLGVVTRLADDPLTAARSLAADIAQRSPDAVRSAKRLYDEAWTRPAEETLALEAELQRSLIGSPNQLAAVTAGMTKQPGEFVDPDPVASPFSRSSLGE
jgi:enoyl-CoA hydratase/carnithine racemase